MRKGRPPKYDSKVEEVLWRWPSSPVAKDSSCCCTRGFLITNANMGGLGRIC